MYGAPQAGSKKRGSKYGHTARATRINKEIKKDVKKEAVDKHLRSAGSVEPNTPAKRLPIGQPNVATRASGMEQVRKRSCYTLGTTSRTIYLC
jgi:hypothetical protein